MTWPDPSGAYAIFGIGETIRVNIFGRDPMGLELSKRKKDAHWVSGKPYSPAKIMPQ